MLTWLLQNVAWYVVVVGASFLCRKPIAAVPRLTTAAWLVVAIKYTPWIWGMGGRILRGECGFRCATSWAALTPWLTLILAPSAAYYVAAGREALGSILVLVISANFVLFEIVAVHLACMRMAIWLCAVPLLGLITLLILGGYAAWQALQSDERPKKAA
jgi:hypothetical protein